MRSFLFVPGDSQRKFENAKNTAADALIVDLEDSIAPDEKIGARRTVREMLDARNPNQKVYIRVNALDTGMTLGDLAAVIPGRPDGIVLPKCAGAADVNRLSLYLDAFEAAAGIEHGSTRIVTVATETARAVLKLMDFENMSPRLWGMMWGAEDLAASLGASRNRTDGRFHSPFVLARDLCLIAAAAAGVVAVDTIATDINDLDALKAESITARQDGFMAKAVIHPKHVDVVNAAFMPTDEEIAWSERVVAAFAGNPSGVAKMDGKMLDRPHLNLSSCLTHRSPAKRRRFWERDDGPATGAAAPPCVDRCERPAPVPGRQLAGSFRATAPRRPGALLRGVAVRSLLVGDALRRYLCRRTRSRELFVELGPRRYPGD